MQGGKANEMDIVTKLRQNKKALTSEMVKAHERVVVLKTLC